MTDAGSGRRRLGWRAVVRVLLAAFMVVAGVSHFVAHEQFLNQVPTWMPAKLLIVWVSGIIEIALGTALVALPRYRRQVGWAVAGFLVTVFPGNVYQAVAGTDAFALTTDIARWVRLLFQPVLVALALWSTGAWPRSRVRAGDPDDALSDPA